MSYKTKYNLISTCLQKPGFSFYPRYILGNTIYKLHQVLFTFCGMSWGTDPASKTKTTLPKKATSQSKNFLILQLVNSLLSPLTVKKKHEDVKLMHKPLIQHNCQ